MGTKARRALPLFKVQSRSQGLTPHVPESQEARGRCSHGSPWRRGQCGANQGQEPTFSHRRPYKNGVGSTPMWPNWEPGVTSLRLCRAPSRTQRMLPEGRQGKMTGRSLRPELTSRPRAGPRKPAGSEAAVPASLPLFLGMAAKTGWRRVGPCSGWRRERR